MSECPPVRCGEMRRIALAWLAVLAILYFVPLIVYGPASSLGWVEFPAPESPGRFMLSVLVLKVGVATAFVGLFHLGRPGYGWSEALFGILSEAVYTPLSALLVGRMLGGRGVTSA